jgi:hypothetical protein
MLDYTPGIRFRDDSGRERLFELSKVASISVVGPNVEDPEYTDLMLITLFTGKTFLTKRITFERCPFNDEAD